MGFRKNWPASRRIILCSFQGLRKVGPRLWPAPKPRCTEIRPLPPELEALPGTIQCSVKRGVQQALGDRKNPIRIDHSPSHNFPPFKSTPLNQTIALIVGSNITGTQIANIQAAIIGSAANLHILGVPYEIVTAAPAGYNTDQSIWALFSTIRTGPYERKHFSGIRYSFSSTQAFYDLAFTVQLNGLTIIDRASLEDLREVSIDVPPQGVLQIFVANRNAQAVYLVNLSIKGWVYTASGLGDYLSESIDIQTLDDELPTEPCAVSDEAWIQGLAGTTGRGGGCN